MVEAIDMRRTTGGKRRLLRETFELRNKHYSIRDGSNGFTLIYVDPKSSTDNIYDSKELLKQYGLTWIPSKIKRTDAPKAWGWILWDNASEEVNAAVYRSINKFANEIGSKETAPESGPRNYDQVVKQLDLIINNLSHFGTTTDGQGMKTQLEIKTGEIKKRAAEFKDMLIKGIGSKETMDVLAAITRFRVSYQRHSGHRLSFSNLILTWMQKPDSTDVRSKSEWTKMGYTINKDATAIILFMPKQFVARSKSEQEQLKKEFMSKYGREEGKLNPSEEAKLARLMVKPKISAGFKGYYGYDVSDVTPGEGAEELPSKDKPDFDWYDAKSEATDKESKLIDCTISYGYSIGIKEYKWLDASKLNGARGWANVNGQIALVNDKRNKGLLAVAIHETAHQIMHFDVVKATTPRLAKFFKGRERSDLRDTGIIEQEAELCTWLVLSAFGYEKQQEHFNYLVNWGMNIKNCANIFDSVFEVSDEIYEGIVAMAQQKYGKQ